jgi:hypothetical protein
MKRQLRFSLSTLLLIPTVIAIYVFVWIFVRRLAADKSNWAEQAISILCLGVLLTIAVVGFDRHYRRK